MCAQPTVMRATKYSFNDVGGLPVQNGSKSNLCAANIATHVAEVCCIVLVKQTSRVREDHGLSLYKTRVFFAAARFGLPKAAGSATSSTGVAPFLRCCPRLLFLASSELA